MAESKFINPLFQRTDPGAKPARVTNIRAQAPVMDVAPEPAVAEAGQAPVKFTFYFMPSQLERLDQLWLRTKLEQREKLNKSEFLRLALDHLMDRFEQDPKGVLAELKQQRAQ